MRILKIEIEEQVDGKLNRVAKTFPLTDILAMNDNKAAGYGFLSVVKQLDQSLTNPRAVVPPTTAAVEASAPPAAASAVTDKKGKKPVAKTA